MINKFRFYISFICIVGLIFISGCRKPISDHVVPSDNVEIVWSDNTIDDKLMNENIMLRQENRRLKEGFLIQYTTNTSIQRINTPGIDKEIINSVEAKTYIKKDAVESMKIIPFSQKQKKEPLMRLY